MKSNQRDRDQVADLILTDPTSGEECYIMTPLEVGEENAMVFEVVSSDSRYRVSVKIEEV